ncbi:hypothetical protein C461_07694 [Halorubrum aidingense JCM 13560]|uniref:ASCH domain-containing protein n=1 Tax=Halorubrum aidingense JCM 13560 TaxID=1230454 RepID=M0PBR2_9EURY|nr:hypothetical protein C461_07694 [Halorubrum aidingense JCM 13560]
MLSIKPEFARKILDGEKAYEFRRTSFRDSDAVDTVFLYASSPDQRIVGAFTMETVIESDPASLWQEFGDESGIETRERFMEYFDGADIGYAYKIDQSHRFQDSIDPWERNPDFVPPTSFHYLKGDLIPELRNESGTSLDSIPSPRHQNYSSD